MACSLAGCVVSRKPKTVAAAPAPPQPAAPAPVPQPLSIPQTRVNLPAPQPVDPAALATAPPVEPSPPVQAKPAPAPARRTPAPQLKADPPQPEPSRPPIREILPADVQRQLQASAQRHKAEIRTLLAQAQRRRLTDEERSTAAHINQFVKLSDDAEKSGDMRSADELAERAHILAKELQSGQ
jgi:hypothetical protein